MRFLRPVGGNRRIDQMKTEDIRQELNTSIFELQEKINKCQQNYYEHILRMPTNQMLCKLFNYHPEGRRKRVWPLKRWRDQSTIPGVRMGQRTSSCRWWRWRWWWWWWWRWWWWWWWWCDESYFLNRQTYSMNCFGKTVKPEICTTLCVSLHCRSIWNKHIGVLVISLLALPNLLLRLWWCFLSPTIRRIFICMR
jgi:hypothetical protein